MRDSFTAKATHGITVTDLFCGAGGTSSGAKAAGLTVQQAMNHWKRAIETHNTNHPEVDHDCADISGTDPRRYRSTHVLLASPECTNHSLAKGQRRKNVTQREFFEPEGYDPDAVRSRATMWDVVRFAEVHRYEAIIAENVVDVTMWELWEPWLKAMHALGYEWKCVYHNSMFSHPTPQSRDRVYIVFWKRGNRRPAFEKLARPAWCPRCTRQVGAVQAWKPGRTWGRYRKQYEYACPSCATIVTPYYYAGINAIDFTIPARRIGDRTKDLQPRTMARIQYGIEKYGRTPLEVIVNQCTGLDGRVRALPGDPLHTQTASALAALVSPVLLETGFGAASATRAVPAATDACPTFTTKQTIGVALPFIAMLRNHAHAVPATAPLPTFAAGGQHHAVVAPHVMTHLRDMDNRGSCLGTLGDPMFTQATTPQSAIIAGAPFLMSYYGTHNCAPLTDPVDTCTAKERHALVAPDRVPDDIRDWFFRMVTDKEIQRAMAFADDYVVTGNAKERVKQLGNAVTPPVMRDLSALVMEALHPECAA